MITILCCSGCSSPIPLNIYSTFKFPRLAIPFIRNKFSHGASTAICNKQLAPLVLINKYNNNNATIKLAASFDSRTNWPNCPIYIMDQGQCGSCYAVSTTTAMSDRLCIATGNSVYASPQSMVTCGNSIAWGPNLSGGSTGCDGAYLVILLIQRFFFSFFFLFFFLNIIKKKIILTERCFVLFDGERSSDLLRIRRLHDRMPALHVPDGS